MYLLHSSAVVSIALLSGTIAILIFIAAVVASAGNGNLVNVGSAHGLLHKLFQ